MFLLAAEVGGISSALPQLKLLSKQQALATANLVANVGGPNKTLGELAAEGKKDPNKQRLVTMLTTNENTGSLNVTMSPGKVTIGKGGNALTTETQNIFKGPEWKKLTTDKHTKGYYNGVEKNIISAIDLQSQYVTAVFNAKKAKDIESAAKSKLPGAISSLAKAQTAVSSPQVAQELVERAAILYGLIEATNVRNAIKPKAIQQLESFKEFEKSWGIEGTFERIAKEISSKAQPQQPAGGQGPAGPGGMPMPAGLGGRPQAANAGQHAGMAA